MSRIDPRNPQPGFYRQRLVRDGPWVAIRIWIEDGERDADGELISDQVIKAERDGKAILPFSVWPGCASQPIDEAEYRYLLDLAGYSRDHDPDDPSASPTKAVDINRTKPVF